MVDNNMFIGSVIEDEINRKLQTIKMLNAVRNKTYTKNFERQFIIDSDMNTIHWSVSINFSFINKLHFYLCSDFFSWRWRGSVSEIATFIGQLLRVFGSSVESSKLCVAMCKTGRKIRFDCLFHIRLAGTTLSSWLQNLAHICITNNIHF